jgi:hypothetical protein
VSELHGSEEIEGAGCARGRYANRCGYRHDVGSGDAERRRGRNAICGENSSVNCQGSVNVKPHAYSWGASKDSVQWKAGDQSHGGGCGLRRWCTGLGGSEALTDAAAGLWGKGRTKIGDNIIPETFPRFAYLRYIPSLLK